MTDLGYEEIFARDFNNDGATGKDNGDASYSVTGIKEAGEVLSITENTPDPDGAGTLSYSWQSSSDNTNWSEISTSSSYTLTSAEEGKYIKAVVSYTDSEGHQESVTTASVSIPVSNPDANGDGFIDNASTYQIATNNGPLEITDGGRTFSTNVGSWQATKVVEINSIYNVLIEGSEGSRFADKFYVWDINTSGVRTAKSGWKTAQQMTDLGYEEIFARDFNNDGAIVNNQRFEGTPLGSTARLLERKETTFNEQSEVTIIRKDEITGQTFKLSTDVNNSADSVTWTEIDNDPLEDILSVENILESRITSHENSIFDDLRVEEGNIINQENVSSYQNVERIIENDLGDKYLNNFSQSESQLNEEELFNSDFLQDNDIQNNQVLI